MRPLPNSSLPAPWARFLSCPLLAFQISHVKKIKLKQGKNVEKYLLKLLIFSDSIGNSLIKDVGVYVAKYIIPDWDTIDGRKVFVTLIS